jgi:hypothetical protein
MSQYYNLLGPLDDLAQSPSTLSRPPDQDQTPTSQSRPFTPLQILSTALHKAEKQ